MNPDLESTTMYGSDGTQLQVSREMLHFCVDIMWHGLKTRSIEWDNPMAFAIVQSSIPHGVRYIVKKSESNDTV